MMEQSKKKFEVYAEPSATNYMLNLPSLPIQPIVSVLAITIGIKQILKNHQNFVKQNFLAPMEFQQLN